MSNEVLAEKGVERDSTSASSRFVTFNDMRREVVDAYIHWILNFIVPSSSRWSARKPAIRIRVYPCPSVAKLLVFFGVRSAFEVWFWATDGHGYTRIECSGFTLSPDYRQQHTALDFQLLYLVIAPMLRAKNLDHGDL